MKNVWCKFYFKDWTNDDALRQCSLAAWALWLYWATTQNNLGAALATLGERESKIGENSGARKRTRLPIRSWTCSGSLPVRDQPAP
jgi:hypothetical protein